MNECDFCSVKPEPYGFTLIELMIVVAIMGILAAIAIPSFTSYKMSSYNIIAESDMRNVAGGEELYYVENQLYLAVPPVKGFAQIANFGKTFISSEVCAKTTVTTDKQSYTSRAEHLKGDRTISLSDTSNITKAIKSPESFTLGCTP